MLAKANYLKKCLAGFASKLAPTLLGMLLAGTASASLTVTLDGKPIDKVLVIKSAHQLQLLSHGTQVKAYHVSLGKQPKGPKQSEGDDRTPEGVYLIDWRHTSDHYNLALHISYPNQVDQARAQKAGVSPGAMIMIHGTPLDPDFPEWYFSSLDWTAGCIAMTNADIREVWSLVKDGTQIEIRP